MSRWTQVAPPDGYEGCFCFERDAYLAIAKPHGIALTWHVAKRGALSAPLGFWNQTRLHGEFELAEIQQALDWAETVIADSEN